MATCRWCGKPQNRGIYCSPQCKNKFHEKAGEKRAGKIMKNPVKYMNELPDVPNNRFCDEAIFTKMVTDMGISIKRVDLLPLRLHPGDVVECLIKSLTRKTAPEEMLTTKEITLGKSFYITTYELEPLQRRHHECVEVFIRVTHRTQQSQIVRVADQKNPDPLAIRGFRRVPLDIRIANNPKRMPRTEYMRLYQQQRRAKIKNGTWNKKHIIIT